MGRGVFNLAPASSPLSLGPIQGLGAGDAGGAFAPSFRPSTDCCCLMRLQPYTYVYIYVYTKHIYVQKT
jgi:hypothetical protein